MTTVHAYCEGCGRKTRHSPNHDTSTLVDRPVIRCNGCGEMQARGSEA